MERDCWPMVEGNQGNEIEMALSQWHKSSLLDIWIANIFDSIRALLLLNLSYLRPWIGHSSNFKKTI